MTLDRAPDMRTVVSRARLRPRLAACFGLALGLVSVGCGDKSDDVGEEESESGSETTTDTGDGGEYLECECVHLDQVCTGLVHQAAQGCYINNPCGVVTAEPGNEGNTECVLGMLMAQETGRFYYELTNENGSETNSGWFYILGLGSGMETGCYEKANGTGIPSAYFYEIADSSHFEGCYGMEARDMTTCLFLGLTQLGDVPAC